MNPVLAYVLKAGGTGLFFANGILLGVMATTQEMPDQFLLTYAGLVGLNAAFAYLGVGQVSKTLEPDVGIRKEDDEPVFNSRPATAFSGR